MGNRETVAQEHLEVSTLPIKTLVKETVTRVQRLIETFRLDLIYYQIITGKGLEFDRLREYVEGDEATSIDWNSLARTTKPYVKVFKEERMLDVVVVLDVSNTMLFGTTDYTKNEYASIIASVIGFASQAAGDKIGLIMFSDKVKASLEPSLSMDNFYIMTRMLSDKRNYGGVRDWESIKDIILKSFGPDTYVFFISDFIGADKRLFTLLEDMRVKFRGVFNIMVRDPLDSYLPKGVGYMYMSDPNTGEVALVNVDKIRDEYNRKAREEEEYVKNKSRAIDAEFMKIHTNEEFVRPFIAYLKSREKEVFI